jgi:excisionase family DNA binding protein
MAETEWLSLSEAARLLGVHPTTVRNWADNGDLPFRRTPGRHRRFQRTALEKWAANPQNGVKFSTPSGQNPQQLVEYALGHTRFHISENELQRQHWYEQLSPTAIENLRKFGRRLLEALLAHLEERYPEGEELNAAQALGREYATLLRQEGLSLSQAIQAFNYFDDSLVESIIQMMAPSLADSVSGWSDLLRQINAFTNEVLITIARAYEKTPA